MRYPKLRELKEAIITLFRPPYTTKFPKVPYKAPPSYRGAPRYDEKKCIGCKACYYACPADAIETIDEIDKEKGKGRRRFTVHYDICQFCGTCERVCINKGGISLSNEYNLATTDRMRIKEEIEKELLACEACCEVVGCKEHLLWLVEKLGPLAYTNPTLLLAMKENLGLYKPTRFKEKETPFRREDYMRILCPACKRKIFITEEWK